uniref:Uncharacterized protein n=1 Tax=Glossina austeni TaxID=7395 RepID=A0A1A9VBP4_GLOAU
MFIFLDMVECMRNAYGKEKRNPEKQKQLSTRQAAELKIPLYLGDGSVSKEKWKSQESTRTSLPEQWHSEKANKKKENKQPRFVLKDSARNGIFKNLTLNDLENSSKGTYKTIEKDRKHFTLNIDNINFEGDLNSSVINILRKKIKKESMASANRCILMLIN